MKKNKTVKQAVIDVVNYYDFFNYAPSFNEIFSFLTLKTSKQELTTVLKDLIKQKVLMQDLLAVDTRYAMPSQSISRKEITHKRSIASDKLRYTQGYIKILKLFPQIRMIGVSGTLSMMYADRHDDIDLFIISARNRIWTARFISVCLAYFMGLKRRRNVSKAPNKVCLNLFFDERELSVPKHKQNLYTAHEVLQVKPLFAKEGIYERFLTENEWVYDLFPNAQIEQGKKTKEKRRNLTSFLYLLPSLLESILRWIQLRIINKHRTSEIITSSQLWFFPQDFEEKLRDKRLI